MSYISILNMYIVWIIYWYILLNYNINVIKLYIIFSLYQLELEKVKSKLN